MPVLDFTPIWAVTYLQIAVAILLFGLGIPALLMQVIVPQELRSIVHKRRRLFGLAAWIVAPVALVTLCFVWLLRPPEQSQQGPWGWVANLLITFAIGVTLVFWLAQSWYRRDRVLRYLERLCARRIGRCGTPDESALEDLRFLGEQGEGGIEKRMVLSALGRLARRLQERGDYAGESLDQVLYAVETTLRGGGNADSPAQSAISELGDSENFQQAAGLLEDILDFLQEPASDGGRGLSSAPDVASTLRVIERVGILALELNYEAADMALLDTLPEVVRRAPDTSVAVSPVLFRLGTVALERKRFRLAVDALSKMESLVGRERPLHAERAGYYLGLIAQFWGAGGIARKRAIFGLAHMSFTPGFKECMRQAKRHHASSAQFETVDFLNQMERDVLQSELGSHLR